MKASILVVDDEEAVRNMLRRIFESSEYRVFEAESGDAGLAADAECAPDLVLTDMKMPGMDGLDMAQALLDRKADRPVLLMTAYADVDSARTALKIGVYEYFIKPLDMHDLLAGVERALERRRLMLENRAYQEDLERKVAARTQALHQKVEDLQARDTLLRHLLSLQEPQETLFLALSLAAGLCGAQFGALYTVEAGSYRLRAALGFGEGDNMTVDALPSLGLDGMDATRELLDLALKRAEPLVCAASDSIREGFGEASMGVLPVYKGKDVVAILEVGRVADSAPVHAEDLARLKEFLPYVAMAIDDCVMQEELPRFEDDIDALLRKTDQWNA